ncbi:MAG: type 2 isopentenyl-diphosphate Delta-isomerase [Proteobacteria bacterium]|nr:type 2 isopentenyl-diphosphate Delta-isomerase [Pseudomonadota bacterium]
MDPIHARRKEQHIELCAREDVEHSSQSNGFSQFTLPQVSLPELNWNEVSTAKEFLKTKFAAPFLITGMTGGIEKAALINDRLASAATSFQIPMGVGSQRIALEDSRHKAIFELKKKHPKLFLIGNIGIGQLTGSNDLDLCKRAIEMIDADALAIHVNVLQELIQVEGDKDFRGVLDRIGALAGALGRPLIVKEVGAGMDSGTVKLLFERGVRAIDVGGTGGTSWALIEGLRASDRRVQRLGQTFRDWGIPTAEALSAAVNLGLKGVEYIATGGMRDGVMALKAVHIGASMVGLGLPMFKAALVSDEAPHEELSTMVMELKIAMMCSGKSTLISET